MDEKSTEKGRNKRAE